MSSFADNLRRLTRMGLQSDGDPAQMTLSPGRLRLTSSQAEPTLLRTEAGPVASYCTVTVTMAPAETGTNEAGTVTAGLVQDANNFVIASFERNGDPAKGTVAIDVRVEGKKTRVAAATADLAEFMRCAFVANENYVTALMAKGADWVPVVQHRITDLLDLRNPAVLHQYRYGFGAGGAGTTMTIADVRAGYFDKPGSGIFTSSAILTADPTSGIESFTSLQRKQACHFSRLRIGACGHSILMSLAGSSRLQPCFLRVMGSFSAITQVRSLPMSATVAFMLR